ncbi:serine hydrolase domain-containing protein [Pseudaminobacter soli (ex Li et al. 2025)]|uniref:Serine hydrolase n=1 Tax=Pseudaminobacter soli (ex Li et al. 2025) TaxID=1295366 RepID=A0A2P7RR75_9HYPH|nr:serine hydrolase domain-containing protein [Mesorhizobium soli]PSJ52717.1 serine hydrolase [Mesorhizobium soli]
MAGCRGYFSVQQRNGGPTVLPEASTPTASEAVPPPQPFRHTITALDDAIDSALADERIVGCVLLISAKGRIVFERAAGLADRETGRPMTIDTPFRYASLTKPFTTMAALKLMDTGVLAADDPVEKWLPGFTPATNDGAAARITVAHLMSHTAGLDYRFQQERDGLYARAGISDGLDEANLSLADNIARIASVPLNSPPGAAWRYSVATDVLGGVIEAVTGRPLPEAIANLVTCPLGLAASFQAVPGELATPYYAGAMAPIRMAGITEVPLPAYLGSAVRFDPARIGRDSSFPSGGAGMAGTAHDMMRLLEAYRDGTFLTAARREEARQVHVGGEAMTQGPGWGFSWAAAVLIDPAEANTTLSPGTVSWGGVYGHWWCIDHRRECTAVLLTNTAYEGMIGRLPQDIAKALGS